MSKFVDNTNFAMELETWSDDMTEPQKGINKLVGKKVANEFSCWYMFCDAQRIQQHARQQYITCPVNNCREWPHRQGGCLAYWRSHGRFPAEAALIYTMHEALRGYCPWGWGCDQSIGSAVSDAIVCSCLWSTATRSPTLGYFSRLLQLVDNWPYILW